MGPSWTLLGPSWGSLGPSWSHIEASEAHRKRKGEKAKTLIFQWFVKDVCLLESAVEGSKGTWIRLGAVLGPLGGMSEAILSHLEVSWAILEAILQLGAPLGPILSHLGRSNASVPPPSWPRGGGRGRGKPFPRAGEGGGREKNKLVIPP